jgi:hypothetical protein
VSSNLGRHRSYPLSIMQQFHPDRVEECGKRRVFLKLL